MAHQRGEAVLARERNQALECGVCSERLLNLARLLAQPPEGETFFDQCLRWSIQEMRVDCSAILRDFEGRPDVFWWATPKEVWPGTCAIPFGVEFTMELARRHPDGLMIRNASVEEPWKDDPFFRFTGVHSLMVLPFFSNQEPVGCLLHYSQHPRIFSSSEFAASQILSRLVGKALEAEDLRHELFLAQESVALSSAIVEDSALEQQKSRLPNRRYMHLWMKSFLPLARRQNWPICLLHWVDPEGILDRKCLEELNRILRGEDLLAEERPGKFWVWLLGAPMSVAQRIGERIQKAVQDCPLGGTHWVPREGNSFAQAMRRAESARRHAEESFSGKVVWAFSDR